MAITLFGYGATVQNLRVGQNAFRQGAREEAIAKLQYRVIPNLKRIYPGRPIVVMPIYIDLDQAEVV